MLILQRKLGTGATSFDLSTATYDSVSFDVSAQDNNPLGTYFKPDGTKMFIMGAGSDAVFQYSLSSAWDLSTASYDSVSFDVSTQDTTPAGIFFKSDGTKMYIIGAAGDSVYQYSLSSAWDLSTASYDSVSFDVSAQDTAPLGMHFSSDGTKMFVVGSSTDAILQYSLSSAWDLSTASYDSISFDVSSQVSVPSGLYISSNGTKMFISGAGAGAIFQYSLSSAWDMSTASYDSVSFDVSSQDLYPRNVDFKPDGTKMFVAGIDTDTIYQYSLS